MRVDESWQARVCTRVFSALMSCSNRNKSCMRVDESWQARVCMWVFLTFISWSNENKSCIRVDKREFAWEFSQLSCPDQTRIKVTWELIIVDKGEFVWEFSQLSCPGQTRTRTAWEWWVSTSESLYVREFCHVLVERESELHESCEDWLILYWSTVNLPSILFKIWTNSKMPRVNISVQRLTRLQTWRYPCRRECSKSHSH